MAVKFNRNFILVIDKRDGKQLRITRPFTVEFDIHRNSFSSVNVASIRVYNLNPNNRSQVRKDVTDYLDLRSISFAAGYDEKLSLAFQGNISQAWSVREGANFITQIESYDGGFAFANAITDTQFASGTPKESIIESLASSLPGVTVGTIGSYPGEIQRGNSFSGATTDLLNDQTGGGFFIDNGKVHCLNDNECLEGDITVVNAQSGLLGTPIREQTYVTFDILFEPNLRVGQLIKLESQTVDSFNGFYKVLWIKHRGVISETVSGQAVTSVGLLPGTFDPVPAAAL